MIKLPTYVENIICKLEKAGFEAFAVGGCIRDMLMGIVPADYDVATSARPEQVKSIFCQNKTVDTGIKHGTVGVLWEGKLVEITTYRIETAYSDGRHPDSVAFTGSIAPDLSRRDFTINAMAFNSSRGLVDPFGGEKDIKKGLIRCVGRPEERFGEDGLRVMRALRFASVLGFSIEKETFDAAVRKAEMLEKVSAERIREELIKLLCGKGVKDVLTSGSGILGKAIPELLPMKGFDQKNEHHIYDVLEHTAAVTAAIEPVPRLRLAALFHDIGKPRCFFTDEKGEGHFYGHESTSAVMTEEIMKRLRFSNDDIEYVIQLVKLHGRQIEAGEKAVKRAMAKLTPQLFYDLIRLKKADNMGQSPVYAFRQEYYRKLTDIADKICDEEQCFSLADLAVNGKDVIEAGIEEGPQVGLILREILNLVIDEKIPNEKETILKIVGEKVQKNSRES